MLGITSLARKKFVTLEISRAIFKHYLTIVDIFLRNYTFRDFHEIRLAKFQFCYEYNMQVEIA